MISRKFLNLALSALAIVSLLLAGSGPALAQDGGNGNGLPHQKHGKITQADRKAAAANAKAAGLQVGVAAPGAPGTTQGGVPDYFGPFPNWAWSPLPTVTGGVISGGVPKFVDALPNLPIATGTACTYSGQAAQCYEIHLKQFQAQLLPTGLPPTTVRGYVEYLNGAPVGTPTYLGPVILAHRDLPVRVTFVNELTSADGDLFLPVDTTYMGAGTGPAAMGPTDCSVTPKPSVCYSENRATLHLHGGTTPWISDGTTHQWTTPAYESAATSYPKGVSVYNVPDMPNPGAPIQPPGIDPGAGTLTFFYSNQQSARLMFYHDHAYGITRLNVYAGEAAGYLLTDSVEDTLINGGNITYNDPSGTPHSVPVAAGTLPDVGTPLVIQDKTFVDANTVLATDPTWNWGTGPVSGTIRTPVSGDLWYPHVYMPNQNPYDVSGANAMGRWDYGPWFWPPYTNLVNGPIANPACLPTPGVDCSLAPWEPPFMPGTPPNSTVLEAAHSPSGVPEAFMDTPIVNGKAYPVLHVAPGLTRFRILNAANDRFLNLQLYQASSIVGSITVLTGGSGYTSAPVVTITPAAGDTTGKGAIGTATVDLDPASLTYGQVTGIALFTVGSGYTLPPTVTIDPPFAGAPVAQVATAQANLYTAPTEVGMLPFNSTFSFPSWWSTSGNPFSLDDRAGGVPDPRTRGPAMIQIGTEGGFLPNPAVILNQPVNYDYNRKSITVLNVLQHALFLGTAERADVLVDFTNFAGKTLILYNDAPAPVPAFDPRVDYYTGDPDQTSTGGAPSTLPGYGPNTRTIMQIVVDLPPAPGVTPSSTAPVDDYNLGTLNTLKTVLPTAFAASQDTVIVPQAAYATAYNNQGVFPTNASQYVKISDTSYSFDPIGPAGQVTAALQPKAIQELFTLDYGRMNATLGVEIPNTNGINQTTIPYGYVDPPTELVKASDGKNIQVTPQGTLADGTQIWKITHNGVDTHTIHFHMFNVQLINRVGWDGAIKPPEPNEMGWKDTVRMNPLEDAIVALRPIMLTNVPFLLPNSWRPLDVTMPLGSTTGFTNVNPQGNPVTVINQLVNFGWEYVWHCHILGHEENDMMRGIAAAIPPMAPGIPSIVVAKGGLNLTWKDNSLNETEWVVQRMNGTGVWTTLATLKSTTEATQGTLVSYLDKTFKAGTTYTYTVTANNVVGSSATAYPNSAATGYPTLTASSAPATVAPPAGTTALLTISQAAPTKSPIVITWSYTPGGDQTGFTIQRATNAAFTLGVTNFNVAGTATSYSDTSIKVGVTYYYHVRATNVLGPGSWSNPLSWLAH